MDVFHTPCFYSLFLSVMHAYALPACFVVVGSVVVFGTLLFFQGAKTRALRYPLFLFIPCSFISTPLELTLSRFSNTPTHYIASAVHWYIHTSLYLAN
jgi:hypothetical protein